jgi:hypothetical protein
LRADEPDEGRAPPRAVVEGEDLMGAARRERQRESLERYRHRLNTHGPSSVRCRGSPRTWLLRGVQWHRKARRCNGRPST